MKTIFKHTLLSLVLLTGAFTTKAQVKIGSSPTTIGANSNLEVQATSGQKVIVEKNVGTVQIENLPSGAVIDSIVTAHPNTGVLRRRSLSAITSLPGSAFMTSGSMPLTNAGQNYPIDFTAAPFNPDGVGDVTNNWFDIKETGWYTINAQAVGIIGITPGGIGHYSLDIYINGTYSESVYLSSPAGSRVWETLNIPLTYLTAGTKLSFKATACYNCTAGNTGYVLEGTSILVQRQF